MDTLGSRIRKLRLQKGLSQTEVAEGNFTASMQSQIESDRARPSYKILCAIAERLEVSLEQLLSNVDLQLEYLSNYKMACAMIRAKEYVAAIPLLQDLLETGRGQIAATDILIELGECYLNTSRLDEAEQAFEQVYGAAVIRQDGQVACQILKSLGVVAFQKKQYQLAIYKFQKALEDFDRLQVADTILKAVIHFHLGQTFSMLGQIAESVEHYKHAATLYEKVENPAELAKVYMGIGQSFVKMADYEKANQFTDRAISLFDLTNDTYMSLKTQVVCALNEGLSGEGQRATRTLERLIVKFQELQKTEDVGITYVELAKVHLHHEQFEKAEECCQVARTFLPEIHVYQAWISRIQGMIAMKREQQDDAIRLFNRAAERFKYHNEFGEWEKTMYDLARIHYDAGDYARAFVMMEDIRREVVSVLENRGIAL